MSTVGNGAPPIQRLLMVADAAVGAVDDLPAGVRAEIDAAAEVYVVTPSLPGRLAWLTDDIDRFRHLADERLDHVLGHVREITPQVDGRVGDEILLTSFDDAVADFQPDHILIGLLSEEHRNWQERGLIEHVRERFGLPLTTYAIDSQGHASEVCPHSRSTTMKKILVGYDATPQAGDALHLGAALARALDGRLMVASAVEFGPFDLTGRPEMSGAPYTQAKAERFQRIFDQAAAELGSADFEQCAIEDDPAHGLHALAERERPELDRMRRS